MSLWEAIAVIAVGALGAYAHWRWSDRWYRWPSGKPLKHVSWIRWSGVGVGCFFVLAALLQLAGVLTPSG